MKFLSRLADASHNRVFQNAETAAGSSEVPVESDAPAELAELREEMPLRPQDVVFVGDSLSVGMSDASGGARAQAEVGRSVSSMPAAMEAAINLQPRPRVICLMGGTNDGANVNAMRPAYSQMLAAAREAGIPVVLGTLPPIRGEASTEANEFIRGLAGPGVSVVELENFSLAGDQVHFSNYGGPAQAMMQAAQAASGSEMTSGGVTGPEVATLPAEELQAMSSMTGVEFLQKPVAERLRLVTKGAIDSEKVVSGEVSDVEFTFTYNGALNRQLWLDTTAGQVLPPAVKTLEANGQTYERRGEGEFFAGRYRLKINEGTQINVSAMRTEAEVAESQSQTEAEAISLLSSAGINEGSPQYERKKEAMTLGIRKEINPPLLLALIQSDVFTSIGNDAQFLAQFEQVMTEAHRAQDGMNQQALRAIESGDRGQRSLNYFMGTIDRHLDTEQRQSFLEGLGFETEMISASESTFDGDLEAIEGDLMNLLKEEIASGEGGYESYNRGRAGDSPGVHSPPLTTMTFGQIMDRQAQSGSGRLFACGKYQLIPNTMSEAVGYCGINRSDRFTPSNQERLFQYLISDRKRPRLNAYITGQSTDLAAAHRDLAYEFASIPGPNGRGMYDGDRANNNAAGGSARARRVASILSAMHNEARGGNA